MSRPIRPPAPPAVSGDRLQQIMLPFRCPEDFEAGLVLIAAVGRRGEIEPAFHLNGPFDQLPWALRLAKEAMDYTAFLAITALESAARGAAPDGGRIMVVPAGAIRPS